MFCNDNSNNVYDFYITDQGIQYMQGSLNEASGNKFSLNANNPLSDYNNQSEWGITYFYKENNNRLTENIKPFQPYIPKTFSGFIAFLNYSKTHLNLKSGLKSISQVSMGNMPFAASFFYVVPVRKHPLFLKSIQESY